MSQFLRPDQPPQPGADELAAIRALFHARADADHQIAFCRYLLRIGGVNGIDSASMGEGALGFNAGKRWLVQTLMALGEIEMVPVGIAKALEARND